MTTKSRYHVRFVNSPYTSLVPTDRATSNANNLADTEDTRSPSPTQIEYTAENSQSNASVAAAAAAAAQNEAYIETSQLSSNGYAETQTAMQEPSLTSTPDLSHSNISKSPDSFALPYQQGAAQCSVGIVPNYFDLDLNLDLFSSDWPMPMPEGVLPMVSEPTAQLPSGYLLAVATHSQPIHEQSQDPVTEAAEIVGPVSPESTAALSQEINRAIIQPQDHELIQHYLNVMTSYTKIRHSANDYIYSQIFSNMALFYAPLYNAIMAWTALHLGQTSPNYPAAQPEERYKQAVSLMHSDQDVAQHFELFLVTIWFLLQYELLAARGVSTFTQHLEYAADLVEAHHRHRRAGGKTPSLGPIGARVLIWLGSYDVRAAYAADNAGRLLQNLEAFTQNHDFIALAFPASVASGDGSGATTTDLTPCLRVILDLDTLESRILQVHHKGASAGRVSGPAPRRAIWAAIHADLLALRARVEGYPAIAGAVAAVADPVRSGQLLSGSGKLSTKHFNWLLVLASFYGVVISYHRVMDGTGAVGSSAAVSSSSQQQQSSELISAAEAAARIVRIALWVNTRRAPSPQNIWPRILFLAGIETTDCVYGAWITRTLQDAEVWGANYGKVRALLEKVVEAQRACRGRVNYWGVMNDMGGSFII